MEQVCGNGEETGQHRVASAGIEIHPFTVQRVDGKKETGQESGMDVVFEKCPGEAEHQECVGGVQQYIEQADEKGVEAMQSPFDEEGEIGERPVKGEQLRLAGRIGAAEERKDVAFQYRIVENDTVVIQYKAVTKRVGVDDKGNSCDEYTEKLFSGDFLIHGRTLDNVKDGI